MSERFIKRSSLRDTALLINLATLQGTAEIGRSDDKGLSFKQINAINRSPGMNFLLPKRRSSRSIKNNIQKST